MLRSIGAAAVGIAMIGAVQAQELGEMREPATAAPAPSFFLFSDTQLSYRYQFPSAEPGVQIAKPGGRTETRDIPKNILGLSHANAWAYGTNFLSLEVYFSGTQDPAGTTNVPGGFIQYDRGSTEIYGLYRGTLSLNKLIDTNVFTVPGIIKDVSLSFGFDGNTKDTAFGPRKKDVVGGLQFAFDVPAGFLTLSVHAYKEWNRNGFNQGGDRYVDFDVAPEFEIVYNIPLPFTSLPLSIAGFNNIVLPKGRGINNVAAFSANPKTGTEFLSRTNLVLDVGKLATGKANVVDAFVGFQYWYNKFGVVETATFKGTEEKSFLAGVTVHLN